MEEDIHGGMCNLFMYNNHITYSSILEIQKIGSTFLILIVANASADVSGDTT